jgi:hypothetical protein
MTLRDYLRELAFPATSATTVIALVTFVVLILLAVAAGLLGLWLAIVTIPAMFRYMTMIAESRSNGADTAAPGIEFFTIVGQFWTLFPAILAIALTYLIVISGENLGVAAVAVVALGAAALLPAMIGVLVLTHSPPASLDPRAIASYIRRSGTSYWYTPVTAMLVLLLPAWLDFLPVWILVVAEVYLVAAIFAVIGGVTRRAGLSTLVEAPDATEPKEQEIRESDTRKRSRVLSHAYGFASRGNRDGALEHIYDWLANDPDPDAAWSWFLDQMLRWEDKYPALLLAQQYLGRLLALGNQVAAVKLMLRCRMLNDRFRPLSPDLPAAIEAATACGNEELVAEISR